MQVSLPSSLTDRLGNLKAETLTHIARHADSCNSLLNHSSPQVIIVQ